MNKKIQAILAIIWLAVGVGFLSGAAFNTGNNQLFRPLMNVYWVWFIVTVFSMASFAIWKTITK